MENTEHTRPYLADPAEVDGPGPEYYRELADELGHPWPPATITRTAAVACASGSWAWTCGKCGGPGVCPDLAATLPYRQCGYAEVDGLGWVHQ